MLEHVSDVRYVTKRCFTIYSSPDIFRSGGFTGTVTLLFQLVVSLEWYGLVRKFHKMEIVQTGMNAWPWCMSMFGARFAVFVRRARVLPSPCPATRNLSFLRFHRHRHPVVSTRNFYWDGTGWCENSTRRKSRKRVRAPDGGA